MEEEMENKVNMEKETSKWWWIGSHNTSDLSPWLQYTLAELDAKTKAMLRVIEEDADSFSKRAEMYYKKRPELIAMVEDLYRTYRSLAEKYDLERSPFLPKHPPRESSLHVPELLEKKTYIEEESWVIRVPETPEKSVLVPETHEDSTYNEESWAMLVPETPERSTYQHEAWSSASEIEEYAESEVDDGEDQSGGDGERSVVVDDAVNDDEGAGDIKSMIDDAEAMVKMKEEIERLKEENRGFNDLLRQKDEEKEEAIRQLSLVVEMPKEENLEVMIDDAEAVAKMKEELERLRDENRVSKDLLREKDEEKREAIRQLCFAVEMLKEENLELKRCVSAAAKQRETSPKKQLWSPFEFKKLKEGFLLGF